MVRAAVFKMTLTTDMGEEDLKAMHAKARARIAEHGPNLADLLVLNVHRGPTQKGLDEPDDPDRQAGEDGPAQV
jgi:hypothetical protein